MRGVPRVVPFIVIATLAVLRPGAPEAGAQLPGTEFPVNSYTTQEQIASSVVADDAGNFVVVWQSNLEDGSGEGIFGQRFDAEGTPLGGQFQVNSYTTNNQTRPRVGRGAAGGFVVVWQNFRPGAPLSDVVARRFDAAGNPIGSEFQVNTYTTGEQVLPAIAGDGNGSFMVVWSQGGWEDSSDSNIVGQWFDEGGEPVGSNFRLNSHATAAQSYASIAMAPSGDFVVAWSDSEQDGWSWGVIGRQFNALGAPAGSEFLVNTLWEGQQRDPSVAMASSGDFVVSWRDYNQDGSTWGVFARRFEADGDPQGPEFRVNLQTQGYQVSPAVAVDPAGDFLVVWSSALQDGSDFGVFGRQFNAEGVAVGGDLQINSHTTQSQAVPAVAASGAGTFVVTWESEYQDGYARGVFGQRVERPLFADSFESNNVCAWSAASGGGGSCP